MMTTLILFFSQVFEEFNPVPLIGLSPPGNSMQRGCWFTGAVVVLLNPPELIITNEDDNTVVHPLKELRLSHICSLPSPTSWVVTVTRHNGPRCLHGSSA